MKTVFYTNLHLDGFIYMSGFFDWIKHDELLFFSDFVVAAIDGYVNVVAETNYDAIVSLKLLFNSIEGEIVFNGICESSRWFQFLPQLNEIDCLVLIE